MVSRSNQKIITGVCVIFSVWIFALFFSFSRITESNSVPSTSLLDVINLYNENSRVRNIEKFSLSEDFLPIVVYVHKRANYFKEVIKSLRQVTDIEKTVLIISHDGVGKDMLELVDSIDFCTVVQWIFPTEPHMQSIMALKNHWWWLVNRVFDTNIWINQLNFDNKSYKPPFIIFLEEDQIVSPDFYVSALSMTSIVTKTGLCRDTECMGVSMYNSATERGNLDELTTTVTKAVGIANCAYVLSRNFFHSLKNKENEFFGCQNGWDMAIANLQAQKLIPWEYYYPVLSRAKNIGVVGLNKAPEEIREDKVIISRHKRVDWNKFTYPLIFYKNLFLLTNNVTENQTIFKR